MKKADIFSGNMNAVNFYTSKKTRVSDINDYEDKDKQSVIQSPIEEFPLKKLKTSKVT